MKKKLFLIIFFVFSFTMIYSQQNKYFIELMEKEIATFNDGIALIRLLYNEENYDNISYIENILWAAQKKLFKVTIPITTDQIDPVLSRREFAFWICKLYNTKGGIVNTKRIMKYSAFRICVNLGILAPGRGAFDSFSGEELLDTFSYLDYYVRYNEIVPKEGDLERPDDTYKNLPKWRERLYKELDEQKRKEKELREQKKKIRLEKRKKRIKQDKQQEIEVEKRIEESL